MKKITKLILVTLIITGSTAVVAGQVGDLNNFVAGQAAVANDVNKNFSDIKAEVNANDTRIVALENVTKSLNIFDFKDYLTTATTNIYSINQGVGDNDLLCNAVTETLVYSKSQNSINANNIDILETESRADSNGINCRVREIGYTQTATELYLNSIAVLLNNRGPVDIVRTLETPIIVLNSRMTQGNRIFDFSKLTEVITNTGVPPEITVNDISEELTFLAIEPSLTLTVNNVPVTYTNCLIMIVNLATVRGSFTEKAWYCPAAGVVKRLKSDRYGTNTYELTSTTP